MKPIYHEKSNNLFNDLNNKIINSILLKTHLGEQVFSESIYDLENEVWRIYIKNPYTNNYYKLKYKQPKESAKKHFAANFSKIKFNVKYYYCMLSGNYEPISIEIVDEIKNQKTNYFVPLKDLTLNKNLSFVNPSFGKEKSVDERIESLINTGFIKHDPNIFRHFVKMGKPKMFFTYSTANYNTSERLYLSINDLDQTTYSQKINEEIGYGEVSHTMAFKLSDFSKYYFLIDTWADKVKVYENINQKQLVKEINIDEYVKSNLISPNGKYIILKEGDKYLIKNKTTSSTILSFADDERYGNIYWDCNSYFLGIGDCVYPIPLIEKLLD